MLRMQDLLRSSGNRLVSCCKVDFVIVSDFFILIKANTHGGVSGAMQGQRILAGG